MDFKNSDITSGQVIADLNSADAAVMLEAAATLAVAMQAGNILPLTADGQLVLPAGVGLDDIKVVGRDLVIRMPDGTQMIVPDGAIFVPQIVVDGVAVPPLNIAALLIGQEPQPEAGRAQSSGGNFADPVGDIGDPFALGDLLPPTALAFPEPEEREIIPELNDEEPTTIIVTPDQPAGSVNATASVNEAALPARGSEPAGSNEASNAETTTGSIVFDAPDGLSSITLNGVAITAVGQVFVTPLGRLTITSIAPGNIGYSYTLTDNTTNPVSNDVFAVVVTDSDGDTAVANLTISIIDDAPTARNDTDSVPAGTYSGQTGNVITGVGTTSGNAGADTQGADGAVLSGIRAGAGTGTFAGAGTTINGQYGTLTIAANGSYTYTRNAGTPGGVNDVFTYQITDGDGDTSTATLTISIADSPVTITSVPVAGAAGTVVDEAGLPARGTEPPGSNAAAPSESTSGTITFTAPDGVASVQINGIVITGAGQIITVPTGTLLITGYNPATGTLAYTFTLTDNTSGDATSQVFTITVTDTDGDTDSRPFTVRIIDDVPTARNDSGTQATENAPVTVNVITNDTVGADGVNVATGVAFVAGSLSGTGTLVYNNNGTFTYTPAPGEQGVVTFNYTITDGDGDVSTATVTINLLADSTPTLLVAGDSDVNESGLPARDGEPEGSDSAAPSETAVGTITVATGGDSLASLVINGVNVTTGGTVNTAIGTLVVTLSGGVYSYSYTLKDNTLAATSSDTFNIVLTDSDGDTASSALVIAIADDAPTAVADTDSIAAGNYGPATGNVISDSEGDGGKDVQGADGVTVTNVAGAGGSGGAGTAVNGLYGILTINADGSYSYVRNAGTPGGVSDVFTYTITDGDGDTSTTTLTIAIANSPVTLDLPVAGEGGTSVDEAGLPAGSNAASDSEKTSGTISFVAADGPATVTIDGVAVTAVGQLFIGSFGTMKITSIANGVIGYEYLLTTNTLGDATFDDFAIVVTDQDGDSSSGTLIIDIVDDVPTARADVDSVTEDNFAGGELVSADGNVITGLGGVDANGTDGVADTKGADGASVTAVAFGAVAGTVGGLTAGAYGTLTLNADGSYSYVLNNFDPRVQGLDSDDSLTEVFTYTLTDGDGDTRTTTLTLTINGSDDTVTINGLNIQGPDLILDDDDLPAGSDPVKEPLTQTGSFTINGVDGISSIKIEGVEAFVDQTFTTAYGTFTITSIVTNTTAGGDPTSITVNYSYTLNDNVPHPVGGGENTITEVFDVDVTDTDGSTESGTVKVLIIDDVPDANNDSAGPVAENAAITVNVIGNDIQGADGVNLATGVALVGGTLTGTGTLVYNANGTFTYTPSAGEEGLVTFNYQITDGDGDTSVATVTLDLGNDSTPTLNASNAVVDEEALADGSNAASTAETTTGTIAITTGNDSIASLIIDGINVTGGGIVTGTYGTLTVTLTAGVYSYSYTLTDNTTDHPTNPTTGTSEGIFDDFNIVLTDSDGDVATDTIVIDILDDGPTARNDTVNQDVENTAITFGVFGNDTFGADGVDIDNNPSAAVTFTQPATGSVSYNPATGLFTFTPVPGQLGTVTYTYTIIDGDGDPSTATVTINLKTDSIPTVTVTDVTVNEDGLPARAGEPAGTSFGSNSHIGTGGFTITTGGDTLQTLEIRDALGNWVNVTAGGTVNGANGTLVVTVSPAGVYSYTYTLADNLENHPDFITTDLDGISDAADPLPGEAFGVRVTDSDNSVSAIDTLNVTVLDDAPVAVNDPPFIISEDMVGTIGGNIFANDAKGADGATLTSVTINGVTVVIAAVGTTAYANANGSYIFAADGTWTFDPNSNLNNANGVDASFSYVITDGDGDPATAIQGILITDGAVPTAGAPISLTMDDQNLSDGSTPANPDFVEGTISFTAGSDALTSFVFGPGTGALAGGLTWNRVSDTVIEGWDGPVGTGTKIVILQLTAPSSIGVGLTDSVTIRATLVNNYDSHPGINIDDLVALGAINVVAADQDGDSVARSVTLSVSDDLPTVTISGPTTVVEGASTAGGTWARSFNADQPGGSIKVIVDGTEYDLGTTITTAKGSLVVNADGTWSFSAANNLDQDTAQTFNFSIKITDADNDFVNRSFAIDITDGAGPAVGAGFTLTLDDQNLADGTTPGNADFVSNDLTFTAGSDALTSFVFAPGTGALAGGLSWLRVSDTQIEGYDGLVKIVTLTLTAPTSIAPGLSGTVTVTATLHDNYDSHPTFTADDLAALGSINVVASDHDGESVSQTVTVRVSDDVPTMTVSGPTTVVEGASTVGGAWSQTIGADQPGAVTKVVFGGVEYNLGTAINTGNGTLTVNADFTWVFEANNNLDNDLDQSVTFSVKVTDADKDVAQDPHTITITDGTPAADAAPITLEVDEAALDTFGAKGSNPGLSTEVDNGPALSFTAGSDALTSFAFSTNLSALVANLDGAGTDIFWSRSGDGQTITGRIGGVAGPIAITLTLSAPASIAAGATGTVTVTATLSDNFQHANALLAQVQSLGSILVEARDHDGNVATGQVTVTVRDDVPFANPDSDSVTEDGPTIANGNVLLGFGFSPLPADVNITDGNADIQGADGASVTAFSFGATNGVVGNAGGLAGAYGTLVLNADGTYTYTLNNALAAVQSLSLGQTLTETYSYTITDADGDPSVTQLVITINGADDGVTITGLGGNAEETVFENDLTDGSSPNTGNLTQPGTFAVTAVDGLNTIVIGGVTVVSAGVLTATLTVDTPLGLLTITGFTPTLGAGGEVIGGTVSYSYLLQDNSLAHTVAGPDGNVFDNFNVVVTDVDGSFSNATLNVEIIDDVPTAVNDSATQLTENAPVTIDVFANDTPRGADGVSASSVALVPGSQVGGGTLTNNGDGTFTLVPLAGQTGTVTFQYKIVDADGDEAMATATITLLADSTPVAIDVEAKLDDDGLAVRAETSPTDDNANAGEVGSGTSSEAVWTGMLGVSSGGADTPLNYSLAGMAGTGMVGTENVIYSWSVTLGVGTLTATTVGGTRPNTILYKVDVTTTTGAYTVTLVNAIKHPSLDGLANDNTENNTSVILTYTVADSDSPADSDSGTITIDFDDDTPNPYVTAPGIATGPNAIGTSDTEALNLPNIGADTPGSLAFTVSAGQQVFATNGTALTYNGQNLFYTLNAADNSILEARTSATAGAGTLVFTIDVNPSAGATGQYVYTQLQQLSTAVLVPVANLSSVGGGNVPAKAIDVAGSPFDIVLTTRAGFTVNTNSTEIGVGSGQSLDDLDVIRIDFVNVSVSGSGSGAVATFNEYYSANAFRQDVSGLSGPQRGDFTVKAIAIVNNANGQALPADGDTVFFGDTNDTVVTGTALNIYNAAGVLQTTAQLTAAGVTVTNLGGGVWQVLNLPNNYDYEITSATTPFQAVQVDALAGTDTFKLGALTTSVLQVQGATFSVPIRYTDADGDSVDNAITINLAAPASPVVLDLDGDGVEFISAADGVTFDYFGDSNRENTAWIGADDGLLAIDRNGDGIVNNGTEIVFARNGLTDLQGLGADYDSNRDGLLTAADDSFALFGVWQDANSNGVTDAGEYRTLSDAGIVSINLVSDGVAYSAANGEVSVAGQSMYTKADGTTGVVADAAFATAASQSAASKTSDQLRTSNVTSSIVAASLVGLATGPDAAAVSPSEGTRLAMLPGMDAAMPDKVSPLSGADADTLVGQPASVADTEFVRSTSDESSSVQAVEHDAPAGLAAQPVSKASDLLSGGADVVDIADILPAAAPMGGDAVMHNILDLAAAGVTAASNDNVAKPAIEDVVNEALPDTMVDRLVEAFEGGGDDAPVISGDSASDSSGYLVELINQSVSNSADIVTINVDPFGSAFQDMTAANNG